MVWRAEDLYLERPVAVKEVFHGDSSRLLREGRAAARLSHPAAVTVFDVLEEDGNAYLVMELVDAVNLAELVTRDGPLPVDRVVAVGLALVDALAAAHAQGIVHRDVKPANVLVRADGRVKLGDFGIAAGTDLSAITVTGAVLGSPNYMSPEQAQGLRDAVGPATDLWSLGATLYYAVEGVAPFVRPESIAVLTAVVGSPPRPPQLAGPLASLLTDLLAKNPADRPSLASVRAQLVAIAAGKVTVAAPVRAATPVPAPAPAPAPALPAPALPAPTTSPVPVPGSVPMSASTRRGSRVAVIAVGLTALVLLGVAGVLLANRHRRSSSSATPPTTAAAASAVGVPAGWVTYRDPATGFSIPHPPGWTVARNGSLTDFRDPASSTYLRVDWTDHPGPSAEGAWRTLAASFGASHSGYTEIGIQPTSYKGMPAATWEYAYDERGARLHAVDLGMVTGRYGFALNFQTTDGSWAASQPLFQAFQAGFSPPR